MSTQAKLGWVVFRDLLTRTEAETILRDIQALGFAAVGAGSAYEVVRGVAHKVPAVLKLAQSPRILGAVKSVVGDDFDLVRSTSTRKLPGAGAELPWHQDEPFFPELNAPFANVVVALEDLDDTTGGLRLATNPLADSLLPHSQGKHGFECKSPDDNDQGTGIELKVGQAVLMSSRVVHRTTANMTDRPVLDLVLQFARPLGPNAAAKLFAAPIATMRAGALV